VTEIAKPAAGRSAARKPVARKPVAAGKAATKAAATKKAAETDEPLDAATEQALAASVSEAVKTEAAAATEAALAAVPGPADPLQLYLLRHADAGDPAAWVGDDADRPLSAKGKRQARRLGYLLSDLKLRPDLVLTSPKLRAAQTAKLVGREIKVKPIGDDRLAEGVGLATVSALLAIQPEARRVILVGHDPDFSAIASLLTGAAVELRKGAIARIDLVEHAATNAGGVLRWLIPPDALPR
jgi:phosphohistidine phosphatase